MNRSETLASIVQIFKAFSLHEAHRIRLTDKIDQDDEKRMVAVLASWRSRSEL